MEFDLEFLVEFDGKIVGKSLYESPEEFLTLPVRVAREQTVARETPSGETSPDGKKGVRLRLPAGVRAADIVRKGGLDVTEDGPALVISRIDGYLCASGGQILASDVFEVFGDVGPATGNISTSSSVRIHGSVVEGYSVESDGDVEALGLVEGARIKAKGSVALKGGMAGADKGFVSAGKDMYAAFAQHGRLEADGSIVIDGPVMGCDVSAARKIIQRGRGGFVGGAARAREEASFSNLGSEGAMPTEVFLGLDPFEARHKAERFRKITDLRGELAEKKKEAAFTASGLGGLVTLAKDGGLSDLFAMTEMIRSSEFETLNDDVKKKFSQLGSILLSMNWIEEEIGRMERGEIECVDETPFHNAFLKVDGTAHPGVRVSILDRSVTLSREYERARFSLKEGKISVSEF